jgi:arabinogalactan oligomer/maltooligosaccharide transport system permease protein
MATALTKKNKRASAPVSAALATRPITTLTYLGPTLVAVILFNIMPIIYAIYMSLTNRNGPKRFAEGNYWITGFDNYVRLLTEPDFFKVAGNTLLYVMLCIPLFFIVGLIFALVLTHKSVKGQTVWRTLMILPWAVPTWSTALIWKFLFHADWGPINQILALIGIKGPQWLNNGTTAFVAITIVNIWMTYPYFMLILIAGLKSIPSDIYEAAEMDGAGYWRQLFQITLPMLRPIAIPAMILSAITTFTMFNTVFLMTGGGPVTDVSQPGATELVMIWLYKQGFTDGVTRYGLMGALSIVLFILLGSLTLLASAITKATKAVSE